MAAVRRRPHKQAHPVCEWGATTWSECDKATQNAHDDWSAFQQVLLAYRIANDGRRLDEDNTFCRLIDYISGKSQDILNKEKNPDRSPWVMRLRSAIERFIAGDFPAYNLYPIPGLAKEASMPHPDTDVKPATEQDSVAVSDVRSPDRYTPAEAPAVEEAPVEEAPAEEPAPKKSRRK